MILAVDIGNTNINIGLFQKDELTVSSRLATERQKTDDQFAVEFLNIFKKDRALPCPYSAKKSPEKIRYLIDIKIY